MKIALVHKRLDLNGGTERDLYLTAEGLRDLGHEVHLFCSEFAVEAPAGVGAHRVPVVPFGRTARLWSFALGGSRLAAAEHCDVIVGFGRILKQDVLRCGGGSHRYFLKQLGAEGGWRRRAWQKLSIYHQSVLAIERRQYRVDGFKEIIAVSGKVKNDLMRTYSIPEHRIRVIYNGVDPIRFTAESPREGACGNPRSVGNPTHRYGGLVYRQRLPAEGAGSFACNLEIPAITEDLVVGGRR